MVVRKFLALFRFHRFGIALLAAGLLFHAARGTTAHAAPQTSNDAALTKVLQQMDAASEKFKSARADFKWDQFTRVVDETDTQTGVIWFKRVGGSTEMAAHINDQNGPGIAKELVYKNNDLQLYQPKIDDLKVYPAGKNSGQYESFLALGFGGRGSDLQKNWTVTLQGMEALSDGKQQIQTARLDLVPKEKKVSDMFTHITMWVDPIRGISLMQKSYEPSGDIRTATYSNIRYNDSSTVPDSAFKIQRKKN